MKIQKTTLYLFGIFLVVVIAGYLMLGSVRGQEITNTGATGQPGVVGNTQGEIQKITLSFKNYNYYPNTVKVKAGQPVSISLDSSVYGCFRDFTIRDFGIREYLRTPQDSVEFTPTKPGTYTFACSMGMGTGTLIVE